ncbi:acetyltransferase [Achromobacter seleniivolatilans]|uniref:Acetyltransferase n=1 Tax=Achromobacter seleniivolatilans TaxID=3047478 RepID=A0ABY9LXM0_9BURK|nr:acetyltransferase [Achromobacter sp. R39]WMD19381.1 acetyltransferase [Achromobacter sp. R39]
MARSLLVVGAGMHGRAVAEAAQLSGMWAEILFVDDRWPELQETGGRRVVCNLAGLPGIADHDTQAIAAVGNNALRAKWVQTIQDAGVSLATVIHPAASVSPSATIEAGTAILAMAMVGAGAYIGTASILNAHCTADHDTLLEPYAHLGTGVHLAGGVKIGAGAWLQAGCCAGYGVVVPEGQVSPPGTALSS